MTAPSTTRSAIAATFTIERPVRPWFWIDELGGIYINVRYGSKVLCIREGLATIVVNSLDNLVPTIQILKEAAARGDFDEAIQDVQRPIGRAIPKANLCCMRSRKVRTLCRAISSRGPVLPLTVSLR